MSAKPSLSRIHKGIPLTKHTLISETQGGFPPDLKRCQLGVRNSAEACLSGGEPSAKERTTLSHSRQGSGVFSKGFRRKVSHLESKSQQEQSRWPVFKSFCPHQVWWWANSSQSKTPEYVTFIFFKIEKS